jgi:hypothetical protein
MIKLGDRRLVADTQTSGCTRRGRPELLGRGCDIFVINKGLDVNDKIVLDRARQVRDGEKVEYEFRPLEQAMRELN